MLKLTKLALLPPQTRIGLDTLAYRPEDWFVIECGDVFDGVFEDMIQMFQPSEPLDERIPEADSATYYSADILKCCDKEPSIMPEPFLFSDMEYLTEVSPVTEKVITPTKNVPVAVNPSEFSWSRKEASTEQKTEAAELDRFSTQVNVPESSTAGNRYISSTNYKTILHNYIQKGKRKLEASSYSKMKATVVSVKSSANSTSLIETVTCASFDSNPPPHSTAIVGPNGSTIRQQPPEDIRLLSETTAAIAPPAAYRCPVCNSGFLSVERLRKHTCIITEQYQCQLCRREFRKRKTLEQHIRSHDKVFSTDDDLRKW